MTLWTSLSWLAGIAVFVGFIYWTWRATTKLEQAKAKEAAAAKERDQRQVARENLAAAKDETTAIEEAVSKVDDKALDERGLRWTK